ncbi:GerAB/ArcD/ProY family transporter [[Brevibacterium] frigoritolerans]|uniref:GerAB/ArcD/ProY family transporter n=1 Tax=Peribacillus frigoritolerans TaxID=450367 RepID=A0A941FGX8_9BACI|nr:GerAB/ArcD/ProY family transporter [Peribacillus frigoritolerans]
MVIIFTIGGSILNVPALLVNLAKQDAWISYIITTLVGLCFVFLYNKLASIYPSKTYVEVNEKYWEMGWESFGTALSFFIFCTFRLLYCMK